MPSIRPATANDAAPWSDLLQEALGPDYPDKQVYAPGWGLDSQNQSETWVAESNGKLAAAISVLPPSLDSKNPICNLGRFLVRPAAYPSGHAEALLRKITEIAAGRGQVLIARVLASDNPQQILFEKIGFSCAGFQPFKHMHRVREGVLFYVRMCQPELVTRLPVSESLPQVHELLNAVLSNLHLEVPASVRDGAVGYPLQSELEFHEASFDDFELWRMQAQSANPPVEISGAFNLGNGLLRSASTEPLRAILAQRENKIVAGIAFSFDSVDRCCRWINSFALDDLCIGATCHYALKLAPEKLNAVYVEVDILVTAPRLLKSLEQLGFVPVAYLPAFYCQDGKHSDVVKLIKLNLVYSSEEAPLTSQARAMATIVDQNFQDQKVGVAIINLLRTLPIFDGLGDGELRKVARLFTQKLFRGAEKIFNKGDSGKEAYVVMRGQIDIVLEEGAKPIATIGNGQIFGELAFLDGAARGALAVANQPSILLVIQRSAFNHLAQQEPHLGMVVMRNIAMELSNRLRKSNEVITGKSGK